MIHENYRRFLRSRRRRELVRVTCDVPAYGLHEADVVRIARPADVENGDSVTPSGRLWFEPLARGDHRLGMLYPGQWEYRRAEFVVGSGRTA